MLKEKNIEDVKDYILWSEGLKSGIEMKQDHLEYKTGELIMAYKKAKEVVDKYIELTDTVEQKYAILYQWMCENVKYDYAALDNNHTHTKDGIVQGKSGGTNGTVNALLFGSCVCQGYTKSMQMLLKIAGIYSSDIGCVAENKNDNKTIRYQIDNEIHADESDHSILKVNLNGKIFYSDVTWDAGRFQSNRERKYFLKSKNDISKDHNLIGENKVVDFGTSISQEEQQRLLEFAQSRIKIKNLNNNSKVRNDNSMNEKIRQSYIESNNLENSYNELMSMYIMNGLELEDLTMGTTQVEATFDSNELMLRGWLLETELCKELEKKGINYDFDDLKQYVAEYGLDNDITLMSKVMKQYETTEQLQKLEEKYISKMAFDLKGIIGNELMSKYNEKGMIQHDGKAQIIQEYKTPEQLAADHKSALLKAEELYVNEGQLDRNSYMQAVSMINKVFDNYMHGSKKIPIEQFRKMQQNVEFENTSSKSM